MYRVCPRNNVSDSIVQKIDVTAHLERWRSVKGGVILSTRVCSVVCGHPESKNIYFSELVFVSRGSRTKWCNRQRQILNVEFIKRLKRRVHCVPPDISEIRNFTIATRWSTLSSPCCNSMVPTVSQPPYSFNVAPLDFFLFSRLKTLMKGHNLGTVDKVRGLHISS